MHAENNVAASASNDMQWVCSGESMAEENNIDNIPVLCVQLNEESRDVIRQAWESLEVTNKTFYDQLGEMNPAEIFVQWDGRMGKAKTYVQAIRSRFAKTPVFLLFNRENKEEKELAKNIKVSEMYTIPFDAIKIRTYFFDKYGKAGEEEEGGENTSAEEGASSGALETQNVAGQNPPQPHEDETSGVVTPPPAAVAAAPKVVKSKETRTVAVIAAPGAPADITLVEKVKEAFRVAALPSEGASTKDGIDYITNQEVLFFDTDKAAIPGFERQLHTFGFSDVRGHSDPATLITRLRQGRGKAVFLWYTGQTRAPGEMLQEIVEMRELHRTFLILFIPGEEAVRKFVSNFPHLPVDGLILRGHKKGIIQDKLNEIWKEQSATQKFIQNLFALREFWRNSRYNLPRKGINEKLISDAKALLETSPHKAYLIHAELLTQDILKGNKDPIKAYFEALKPFTAKSFDAVMHFAAKASTENTESATNWLMREGMGFHLLNKEKLYTTIKLLLKWKQFDAAKTLILRWYDRKDIPSDGDLHYVLSLLYQKTNNEKEELLHLKHAVVLDPLMIDNVAALAELFERRNNNRMATKLWEVLARADLAVTANFKYRFLRGLIAENNIREAKKEIEIFYPGGITDDATRQLFEDMKKAAS